MNSSLSPNSTSHMIPADLQADNPDALLLLLCVPLIALLYLRLFYWRQKAASAFSSPFLSDEILLPPSRRNRIRKASYLCLAWICAVAALMQLKGAGRYPEAEQLSSGLKHEAVQGERKMHELYFLIDTSASMAVNDADQKKPRLESAKELADEIAGHLQGEATALYSFTSEAVKDVPATMDYLFLRMMISHLHINDTGIAGTDLARILQQMQNAIKEESPQKVKTILLFSDGGDTLLDTLNGDKKTEREKAILKQIGDPNALKLEIYTIGIGSLEGGIVPHVAYHGRSVKSALNASILKQIANQGKGLYWNANESNPADLTTEIIDRIHQRQAFVQYSPSGQLIEGGKDMIYDYYFQIPLFFAVLCLGAALLIPEVEAAGIFNRRAVKREHA